MTLSPRTSEAHIRLQDWVKSAHFCSKSLSDKNKKLRKETAVALDVISHLSNEASQKPRALLLRSYKAESKVFDFSEKRVLASLETINQIVDRIGAGSLDEKLQLVNDLGVIHYKESEKGVQVLDFELSPLTLCSTIREASRGLSTDSDGWQAPFLSQTEKKEDSLKQDLVHSWVSRFENTAQVQVTEKALEILKLGKEMFQEEKKEFIEISIPGELVFEFKKMGFSSKSAGKEVCMRLDLNK